VNAPTLGRFSATAVGKVIGHCEPSAGIEPFSTLANKVMAREP
jgi:hypothetical protein